jgi:hypothetical protein
LFSVPLLLYIACLYFYTESLSSFITYVERKSITHFPTAYTNPQPFQSPLKHLWVSLKGMAQVFWNKSEYSFLTASLVSVSPLPPPLDYLFPCCVSSVRGSSSAGMLSAASELPALRVLEGQRLNQRATFSPVSVPHFVPKSQSCRICAHSFTLSLEKVSYLLTLY